MNNLKVHCYSGHTYAERPQSFEWQGVKHKVEEIEKAWLEAGKRCSQVRTNDNKIFQLCYNEAHQEWSAIDTGRRGKNAKKEQERNERNSESTGE